MLHPCSVPLVFAAILVYSFGRVDGLALPPWTEICPLPVTQSAMDAPIVTVREKFNVQVDGYCVWAPLGDWANQCYDARRARNYTWYAEYWAKEMNETLYVDRHKNMMNEPFTFSYDHGTRKVRTDWRAMPFDDAYCEANDWMNLPKQHLDNFTYWHNLAKQECNKLLKEFPEYKNLSMTEYLPLAEKVVSSIAASSRGVGGGPTIKDFKRTAVVKCLIGGLGCDMGNCAVNFCRLGKDGMMGHTPLECGANAWAPRTPPEGWSWSSLEQNR